MIIKVNASWVLCKGPGSRSRERSSLLHASSAWSTAKGMTNDGMPGEWGGGGECEVLKFGVSPDRVSKLDN